jgi:hypothetical protein
MLLSVQNGSIHADLNFSFVKRKKHVVQALAVPVYSHSLNFQEVFIS